MKITLTEVDLNGNEIGTTELDMEITQEEIDAYSKLFCECDYLEKHPNSSTIYVKNYKGVNHGYICPKCKKFSQIG